MKNRNLGKWIFWYFFVLLFSVAPSFSSENPEFNLFVENTCQGNQSESIIQKNLLKYLNYPDEFHLALVNKTCFRIVNIPQGTWERKCSPATVFHKKYLYFLWNYLEKNEIEENARNIFVYLFLYSFQELLLFSRETIRSIARDRCWEQVQNRKHLFLEWESTRDNVLKTIDAEFIKINEENTNTSINSMLLRYIQRKTGKNFLGDVIRKIINKGWKEKFMLEKRIKGIIAQKNYQGSNEKIAEESINDGFKGMNSLFTKEWENLFDFLMQEFQKQILGNLTLVGGNEKIVLKLKEVESLVPRQFELFFEFK